MVRRHARKSTSQWSCQKRERTKPLIADFKAQIYELQQQLEDLSQQIASSKQDTAPLELCDTALVAEAVVEPKPCDFSVHINFNTLFGVNTETHHFGPLLKANHRCCPYHQSTSPLRQEMETTTRSPRKSNMMSLAMKR
jgi:hypothetical protein